MNNTVHLNGKDINNVNIVENDNVYDLTMKNRSCKLKNNQ